MYIFLWKPSTKGVSKMQRLNVLLVVGLEKFPKMRHLLVKNKKKYNLYYTKEKNGRKRWQKWRIITMIKKVEKLTQYTIRTLLICILALTIYRAESLIANEVDFSGWWADFFIWIGIHWFYELYTVNLIKVIINNLIIKDYLLLI